MGWHKKHSNSCRMNKDAVEIVREEAYDHASFDVSVGYAGGVRNICSL